MTTLKEADRTRIVSMHETRESALRAAADHAKENTERLLRQAEGFIEARKQFVEALEPPRITNVAKYAILVEYTLYRGALVAFDLPTAIRESASLSRDPSCLAITVRFVDGRDDLYVDFESISRPKQTATQARARLIANATENLKAHRAGTLIARSCDIYEDLWTRWAEGSGPTEEEVKDFVRSKREWVSPEELAKWEQENIPQ